MLKYEESELAGVTFDSERVSPNTREHMIETYIRSTSLVRQARKQFGLDYFMDNCSNSFIKPDSEKYIEVHHIIPLYEDGEDHLDNLAMLCAHHHNMAHFAKEYLVRDMREKLLSINKSRLS